jgi:hypothetical protein
LGLVKSLRTEKTNDNAYRIRLPNHLKTSNVFNVNHLTPYFIDAGSDNLNLKVSFSQLGKTDARVTTDTELMALAYLDREDQHKDGKNRHD